MLEMTKPLTASMKADRTEMARQINELAKLHGAEVERSEGGEYLGSRAIRLEIKAAEGLRVSITLDGASRDPDSHSLNWNFDHESKALFTDVFGGVNQHHYKKAHHYMHGFPALVQALGRGLEMAASGTAFRPSEEAAQIVAANKARYAAMVESSRRNIAP